MEQPSRPEKPKTKLPRKRPELLLAAAGLLCAAVVLLVMGTRATLNPAPAAEQSAVPQSPAGAVMPDPFVELTTNAAQQTDVIGYTGIVIYPAAPPPAAEQSAVPQSPAGAVMPDPFVALTTNAAPQTPQYPVHLNTATQAQLETLPGIGPVKAQAILAWRAAHGIFTSPQQLLEVKGIGEKTLEKLLPYIAV